RARPLISAVRQIAQFTRHRQIHFLTVAVVYGAQVAKVPSPPAIMSCGRFRDNPWSRLFHMIHQKQPKANRLNARKWVRFGAWKSFSLNHLLPKLGSFRLTPLKTLR